VGDIPCGVIRARERRCGHIRAYARRGGAALVLLIGWFLAVFIGQLIKKILGEKNIAWSRAFSAILKTLKVDSSRTHGATSNG